jgi:dipeptidase D
LSFISEFEKATQAEFISTEANLTVSLVPAELDYELEASAENNLLSAIYCAPHGVHRMSAELDGVTETSCNLGVINLCNSNEGEKAFDACLLVRSLVDSAVEHLACGAKAAFSLIQAEVMLENGYPGWRPPPVSGLLSPLKIIQ